MGLILAGLAGAAGGLDEMRGEERKKKENKDLMEARAKLEEEMQIRKEKRMSSKEGADKAQNLSDLKTINQTAQTNLATGEMQGLISGAGVGSKVSPEDLANIKSNPDAVTAYRNAGAKGLLNPTRQQTAEAQSGAAMDIGRTDYAKSFEDTAKGERADTRESDRVKAESDRVKLQDKQQAETIRHNIANEERQMKLLDKQLNSQISGADKAKFGATISGYQDIMKSHIDRMRSIEVEMAKIDPTDLQASALRATLQSQLQSEQGGLESARGALSGFIGMKAPVKEESLSGDHTGIVPDLSAFDKTKKAK